MKRRSFVKGTLAAGAAGLAVGAGLVPATVFAADDAAKAAAMASVDGAAESGDIKMKAPEIAENGAVVPVSVDASAIAGATSVQIIATNNPSPVAATFTLGEGAVANVSTRIKMGKSGPVVAVVTAGDKTFKTSKDVKVTIGGCGG